MPPDSDVVYEWRGEVDDAALNRLHAEGFEHPLLDIDWRTQLDHHSLGWVCARRYGELVGFVNVAWDGGVHAFVLDTVVVASARGAGIGTGGCGGARPSRTPIEPGGGSVRLACQPGPAIYTARSPTMAHASRSLEAD